jgi:uncharacterized protein YybS (DUF2232 family)
VDVRRVLVAAGLGLLLATLQAAPPGLVGGLLTLLGLAPVALAVGMGGPVVGGGVAAAVAIAGTALIDVGAAVMVALRHAAPGVVLGWALRRRVPLATALGAVAATSLAGMILLLWAALPPGTSPWAPIARHLEAQVADLERLPDRLGKDRAGLAADAVRTVAAALRATGPAIIVIALLVVAGLNWVLVRCCLRGPGFRPFAAEAVPDHAVWAVIVGGLLLASGHPAAAAVGLNLLVVLAPFYAIQGFAVLRHFFLRARVPRLLQAASFGLLALQVPGLLVVAGVGLSDLWVDFRKIRGAATPA